jgi:hypothetical protein
MLFDRNPLWTTFCDKWMSRDYVAKRGCAEHLVPVLWHGADPADIPFDALPSRMVIKATHGCGYNIILNGKSQCDRAAAQSRLQRWLLENFCTDKYIGAEWGYRNVRPVIIVEQFIGEPDKVPVDYKFYCFSGRAEYVLLSFDRFGSHAKEIVDREFMPTGIRRGHEQYRGEISPPPNLDAMLRVAETLAHGLDMIRVDLYNVNGRIFFGEMTCYPGGGMIPFEPRSEDFAWGAKWQLAPFVQPKTDGTQSS